MDTDGHVCRVLTNTTATPVPFEFTLQERAAHISIGTRKGIVPATAIHSLPDDRKLFGHRCPHTDFVRGVVERYRSWSKGWSTGVCSFEKEGEDDDRSLKWICLIEKLEIRGDDDSVLILISNKFFHSLLFSASNDCCNEYCDPIEFFGWKMNSDSLKFYRKGIKDVRKL